MPESDRDNGYLTVEFCLHRLHPSTLHDHWDANVDQSFGFDRGCHGSYWSCNLLEYRYRT
jgi:hypothetical protein